MEAWVAAYQLLLLGGCVRPPAAGGGGVPPRRAAPWVGTPSVPPPPPPARSVLLTAAAGGASTAAVQLAAAHFGLPMVIPSAATPGRRAEVGVLGATATVPRPPVAVVPRGAPGAYADAVRAAVGGDGGVDLLLDAVGGGAAWAAHSRLLGPDGVWVLYAALGGGRTAGPVSVAALLSQRLTVVATTLRGRPRPYREGLVAAFGRAVLPELAPGGGGGVDTKGGRGGMAPVIHTVMGLEEAEAAHALVASNAVVGKVVLRVADA